jgi:hypothetical protein
MARISYTEKGAGYRNELLNLNEIEDNYPFPFKTSRAQSSVKPNFIRKMVYGNY